MKYANEACDLIDTLLSWVEGRLNPYRDDEEQLCYDVPCSFDELARKWDTLVRNFDLCMSLQGVTNGQDGLPPQDASGQRGDEKGQTTSNTDMIKINLNEFSDSGSYRLLYDLLSDSERYGIQLNKKRYGSTTRQPKSLKELLKKKANNLESVAEKIKRKKDNKRLIFLDIPPEKIDLILKNNGDDGKN
jgi:hypothetical protein